MKFMASWTALSFWVYTFLKVAVLFLESWHDLSRWVNVPQFFFFWGPLSFKLRRRRAWYLLNSRVSPSWQPFHCTSVLSKRLQFLVIQRVLRKNMRIWPQNNEAFWGQGDFLLELWEDVHPKRHVQCKETSGTPRSMISMLKAQCSSPFLIHTCETLWNKHLAYHERSSEYA